MAIRGFGSDNNSGVHPDVLKAINEATYGHQLSYGDDQYTQAAEEQFKRIFGEETEVYFVYNGTGANILALSAFLHSYQAVICAETAHINVDECGALECQTGCKILTLPTFDGKLTIPLLHNHMKGFNDQHHSQPKMISITQCTELGTAYSPEEIRDLCDFAHEHGMYVHMDGARFANAVAHFKCDPCAMTTQAGVDVMSFGGTKNGMLFGEAVLFFNTSFPKEVKYLRKQQMQLHSKSRYIGAQFSAMLKNDLWLHCARHANTMAQKLAREAEQIDAITVTQTVQGNEVFAIIPRSRIEALREEYFFYTWNDDACEVRWVCSFDTTESDIIDFVNVLREELC